MSGHKILIELEPEVEQRLREACGKEWSLSAVASEILNAEVRDWIIRDRRRGQGADQEGKALEE